MAGVSCGSGKSALIGLPGFGCCTPTLERETPDDRDEPAAPPHDRGYDGSQSFAGNPAILRSRRRQIRPLLRPFAGETRSGRRPRLSGPFGGRRDVVAGSEPNSLRAALPVRRDPRAARLAGADRALPRVAKAAR